MKKFTGIFLVIILVLCSFSGCGRKQNADVHVFYYSYSDPYISTVRSSLDNALKRAGISYHDYDSNNSQTTQTEQVQTAITKGAKLLVVNIVTTGSDDAASGIISLAQSAGIPVIFFNREVSSEIINSYSNCVFIGTDAAEAGYLQGDMIGDYVVENFESVDLNKDGKISYVMFMGEKGNNEAIYRTEYSVKNANAKLEAAGLPALEFYDRTNPDRYLLDRDGKWSAQASNDYMNTILSSHSVANKNMVELVICNNDGMAEGAISALNAAGFNTGSEGSIMIPVFGVDATPAARELIKAGKNQDGSAMANAILKVAENAFDGDSLLDDMEDDYTIDPDSAKLRISYSVYLGE